MIGLQKKLARQIIETVGSQGTPPEWGFQFFSAGLEEYLRIIEDEYLKNFIREGGASFKIIVGTYGGGKTHFLYSLRELAWKHDYLVSYCPLSAEESPFFKLELVYRSVVKNLMRPLVPEELFSGAEKGMASFVKSLVSSWTETLRKEENDEKKLNERIRELISGSARDIENVNFARGIREILMTLIEERDEDFQTVLQWMNVDGYERKIHRHFGILQPVDRGQAFSCLRSLIQWVRNLKYRGMVILFDEAEQIPSLSSRQRELMLGNIRELIDECGHATFRNVMIFYAIPNETFFEGRSSVYEALRQRINTVFDFYNPSGVKIMFGPPGGSPRARRKAAV
jgi:hypothetical protein